MLDHNPGCMGQYDFDKIVYFTRKRFIDGFSTIELMEQAKSEQEKEEIAFVAMLDLDDETVKELKLSCKFEGICEITYCRELLKQLIEDDLENRQIAPV